MRFLIVGLGSMGKRRVRCLLELGYKSSTISGFDIRKDRREDAKSRYGIATFEEFDTAIEQHEPDVLIISVPPDGHHKFMNAAVNNGLSFFVELNVIDTDMPEIIKKAEKASLKGFPSATLMFHPAIKIIKELLQTQALGNISSVTYHSGQYLPDWHTYESVGDYYVSKKETGGAREMTPFELTWITQLFGFPERVSGVYKKTINMEGAETIDDTYSFLLDYDTYVINGLIDVVSRAATRKLLINGDKKQLTWNWDEEVVNVYDPEQEAWEMHSYSMAKAEKGYDSRIGENMYIDEIRCFIDAVEGEREFPNTLGRDHKVLKLLYAIEHASDQNCFVTIDS